MQFKDEKTAKNYAKLMSTTLSGKSIKALGMAQDFSNIVEQYIDYNGESEVTILRGIDLALSHSLKKANAYSDAFNLSIFYLRSYWKYHDRVKNIEELLSNLTNNSFLLINI